jgi:hypothetical protein
LSKWGPGRIFFVEVESEREPDDDPYKWRFVREAAHHAFIRCKLTTSPAFISPHLILNTDLKKDSILDASTEAHWGALENRYFESVMSQISFETKIHCRTSSCSRQWR